MPPRRARGPGVVVRVLQGLAGLFGLCLAVAAVHVASIDVDALATHEPGRTAMMRQREREAAAQGRPYHETRRWTAYEGISPHLRRAVLIAEDDAFYSHDGLDWNEIKASARKDLEAGRFVRGGSTITQQLAKNLWLGSSRTPWRKLEEVLLALRLEHALPKKRIFELYLNVIEWGDGIYGADAAARYWFHTPVGALSARQGVRLAAVIINPRRFSPVEPPRRIERRIRMIASRMRRRGELAEDGWRDVMGLPPAARADSAAAPPAAAPDSAAM